MAGVLGHSIVPLHEVMSNNEAIVELEPFGLVKDGFVETSSLPLIAIDDPALFDACYPRPDGVSASWPINSVVRITRRSAFAGISIFYRVVSSQPVYPTKRWDPVRANATYEFILDEFEEEEMEQTQTFEEETEKTLDELMSETNEFLKQEEAEQQ